MGILLFGSYKLFGFFLHFQTNVMIVPVICGMKKSFVNIFFYAIKMKCNYTRSHFISNCFLFTRLPPQVHVR